MMSIPRGKGDSGDANKVGDASKGRLLENADGGRGVQRTEDFAEFMNGSP